MNPGDLVVKYSDYYDDNDRDILIEDLGIILRGSWREGSFQILFSRSGVKNTPTGRIRRIRVHTP